MIWRRLFRLVSAWRSLAGLAVFWLWIVSCHSTALLAQETSSHDRALPSLQVHPLPLALAQWHDSTQQGDYFSQVRPTDVGYLVWSHPVTVFVEPADESRDLSSNRLVWVDSVRQAVYEWSAYFPLALTDSPDADITIWRRSPPLQRDNGLLRARSAETRYTLYVQRTDPAPPILVHRVTITLRPNQTASYIQAAARHELGHALGIWGHSPLETDALYFSQVRNPPPISIRDVNTLKRVYEQPTRLGWEMGREE